MPKDRKCRWRLHRCCWQVERTLSWWQFLGVDDGISMLDVVPDADVERWRMLATKLAENVTNISKLSTTHNAPSVTSMIDSVINISSLSLNTFSQSNIADSRGRSGKEEPNRWRMVLFSRFHILLTFYTSIFIIHTTWCLKYDAYQNLGFESWLDRVIPCPWQALAQRRRPRCPGFPNFFLPS